MNRCTKERDLVPWKEFLSVPFGVKKKARKNNVYEVGCVYESMYMQERMGD
jgi:hypothetical protein